MIFNFPVIECPMVHTYMTANIIKYFIVFDYGVKEFYFMSGCERFICNYTYFSQLIFF